MDFCQEKISWIFNLFFCGMRTWFWVSPYLPEMVGYAALHPPYVSGFPGDVAIRKGHAAGSAPTMSRVGSGLGLSKDVPLFPDRPKQP